LGGLAANNDDTRKPWEKRKSPAPLSADDFLSEPEIVFSNMIFVPKAPLSTKAANRIRRIAVIKNPEYGKKLRMRLPVSAIPRTISCVREEDGYIGIPRGLMPELLKVLDESGVNCRICDRRSAGVPIKAAFNGELKEEQQSAADAMMEYENGVLHAATAFGKTVVAEYMISKRKWYGEVNYFGRNNGDETCLRLDNRELAEELLEFAWERDDMDSIGFAREEKSS
jgi:hypothetical protein